MRSALPGPRLLCLKFNWRACLTGAKEKRRRFSLVGAEWCLDFISLRLLALPRMLSFPNPYSLPGIWVYAECADSEFSSKAWHRFRLFEFIQAFVVGLQPKVSHQITRLVSKIEPRETLTYRNLSRSTKGVIPWIW